MGIKVITCGSKLPRGHLLDVYMTIYNKWQQNYSMVGVPTTWDLY